MTSISIIVPVHRLDEGLSKCLHSLGDLNPPPDEILLVLDGVEANMLNAFAPHAGDKFRKVGHAKPGGAAAARNLGAASSKGNLLLFVDSDASVPKDLASRVKAHFDADARLSALFGSYDDEPGQGNFFSQFKNLMHHFVHQHAGVDATTFWGACGAIRRGVFETIGGFDESMAWLEDVDLGMRLSARGETIRLTKSLQVKHWKKWTMASVFVSDVFHRAIPWTSLIVKHRMLQNDLNTDARSRFSAIFIFALLGILLFWGLIPFNGILASGVIAGLVILNRSFYLFLLKKRGLIFLLPAIVWHWFYYVYSSLAFLIGIILALLKAGISPTGKAV